MVSVKNEINEVLLNAVSDLENRLEESRAILSDIQSKMDSKVSEAKEYKVLVDDAKENIKRLEEEIKSLENDLAELKEKYGKKNLVAVIEAGTKEINLEIKKKQDEIQVHKNKIAELTNRARSIKDLLFNLKKDKKIKEERLEELEHCTKYYKTRLEEVVDFAEEHDNLDDYFVAEEIISSSDTNIFEDIVDLDNNEVVNETNEDETETTFEEVSIAEVEEVFNEVINPNADEVDVGEEKELNIEEIEDNEEDQALENNIKENIELEEQEEAVISFNLDEDNLDNTRGLEINDLLSSVKEPVEDKLVDINQAIDEEFENIFGKNINEPIKTMDIFGNEFVDNSNEESEIVNILTNIGLDYYSFTESDREIIKNNFNEKTISEIINVLKDNKIQLDNVYVDAKLLSSIAPSELSNIISKLLEVGQSADAIGYVLDKLPLVDGKLLDNTINNYGDYIKNVDIVDIIVKSLKGDN